MKMRSGFLASLITLLIGCAGADDPRTEPADAGPGDGKVSYSRDIQPIWNQWCLTCHSWKVGPEAFKHQQPQLDRDESHTALVMGSWKSSVCYSTVGEEFIHLQQVVPGEPDQSGVVAILDHERVGNGCFTSMPRGSVGLRLLAPNQYELVRRWILEGALNN